MRLDLGLDATIVSMISMLELSMTFRTTVIQYAGDTVALITGTVFRYSSPLRFKTTAQKYVEIVE